LFFDVFLRDLKAPWDVADSKERLSKMAKDKQNKQMSEAARPFVYARPRLGGWAAYNAQGAAVTFKICPNDVNPWVVDLRCFHDPLAYKPRGWNFAFSSHFSVDIFRPGGFAGSR
jgi:hypothetical protein